MQIRQLEYFVAVAEQLNFTKAARQFYISQTAVTQQIRVQRSYEVLAKEYEDIFLVFESKDPGSDFTSTCDVYVTEESRHTIEVMKKYQIYDYKDILNAYK